MKKLTVITNKFLKISKWVSKTSFVKQSSSYAKKLLISENMNVINGKMEKVHGKICGNKQPAIERMFGK